MPIALPHLAKRKALALLQQQQQPLTIPRLGHYHIIPKDFDVDFYMNNLVPQPGPQTVAHASNADILIFGGGAGGGKSRFLVFEPARYFENSRFEGVLFRESYRQIFDPRGLWDECTDVYSRMGGKSVRMPFPEFRFPSKARMAIREIGDENKAMRDLRGIGAAYYGFDEVTDTSERLFFFIALGRGRSLSGIAPYTRGTCNPDPQSWLKTFLAPWLVTNWPGPGGSARPGEIRYFRREGDDQVWSTEPLYSKDGLNRLLTKTVTFVPSTVYDNKVLLAINPEYLTGLENLGYVDRERLLNANWDVDFSGNMFRKQWFKRVSLDQLPPYMEMVRFWDLAASQLRPNQKEPDYTAGGLEGRDPATGMHYLLDLILLQETPGTVRATILRTAKRDRKFWGKFGPVKIRMEQEPGASGLTVVDDYANIHLVGYDFDYKKSTGNKVERAKPLSADAEHGKVSILVAEWNNNWFKFAGPFPRKGVKDDPVDAFSGSHAALNEVDEGVCPVNPEDRYAGLPKG